MDKKLLDILCCPVTKQPIKLLSIEKLGVLNEKIASGGIRYVDESLVEGDFSEALITLDESTIYPVQDGIPLMTEERGILTKGIEGWVPGV
ncbi:MAG: Trm112 family protein [Pseudomonadota bacterium]